MSRKNATKSVPNNDANVARVPRTANKLSLKLKIDDLRTFDPLTDNQKLFFECYDNGNDLMTLHGVAGTGKTFCAIYKALEEVMDKSYPYDKIIVVRSAVQSRDLGHLPGDVDEKMDIYKQPYREICQILFDRKDAWARLEEQGYTEFISTSFLRGCTWNNSIVIVDEMQNLTFEELHTVITRIGENSKIIFCGDYRQTDLKKSNEKSGIFKFQKISDMMRSHTRIEFTVDDIVRSDIVREWIVASIAYDDENK